VISSVPGLDQVAAAAAGWELRTATTLYREAQELDITVAYTRSFDALLAIIGPDPRPPLMIHIN